MSNLAYFRLTPEYLRLTLSNLAYFRQPQSTLDDELHDTGLLLERH